MSVKKPRGVLATAIRAALRHRPDVLAPMTADQTYGGRAAAYAGVALVMLQTQTAGAITIGQLRVESALGEPLRGTASATIRPGESLASGCITTSPYKLGNLRLKEPLLIRTPDTSVPGQYEIEIATAKPLYEPMYEVQLRVDCPGMPALTRSYIVMLDAAVGKPPAATAAAPQAREEAATNARETAQPVDRGPAEKPRTDAIAQQRQVSPPKPAARPPGKPSINPGTAYQVVAGDTLFGIAARVSERPAGTIWAVVDLLFRTNPDAFIDGRRDRLKLGATLRIPGSDIVANVRTDIRIEDDLPSTPAPERKLPARPALVREDQVLLEERSSEREDTDSPTGLDVAVETDANTETVATMPAAMATEPTAGDSRPELASENDATASASATATIPTLTRKAPDSTQAARETEQAKTTQRIVYPANDTMSPLLAGMIGMVIGALFAVLLIYGRRFLERFARPEWAGWTGTLAAKTFDATEELDALRGFAETDEPESDPFASIAAHIADTADQPQPDRGGTLAMRVMGKDSAPDPQFGTIEVEMSDLNEFDKKNLGFDILNAPSDETAEQPQLGESPRINLEGLGENFDLQSELQEMLQEFSETENRLPSASEKIAATEDLTDPNLADATDTDLKDTGEITHPDLSAKTGYDTMKDLQSLADATGQHDHSSDDLDMQPFSVGLDLDLELMRHDETSDNTVDVSLEDAATGAIDVSLDDEDEKEKEDK